ncbi:Cryparin [Xylaria sp. FL0933]|nr:Cryparin [Xylaria sp. FL0933]
MQLTTLFVSLLATAVVANPTKRGGTPYDACPDGLYSVPQCCATDVLGVADLNCASPSAVPSSPSSFQSICAAGGERARCCVLPVLGQDVLCETPVGVV